MPSSDYLDEILVVCQPGLGGTVADHLPEFAEVDLRSVRCPSRHGRRHHLRRWGCR